MRGKRSNRWDHQHLLILSEQSETLPSHNQLRLFLLRRHVLINRTEAKTTQPVCLIVLLSLYSDLSILSEVVLLYADNSGLVLIKK